ncbi:MAG TPA: dihydrolipoyl dehydrogenase [Stellaceae bacterium]|jgi:dihydrolipoamide dehydrogenase|nr:dihydrolipoyl dehydrogenase [Stellaceae bacterium]
MADTYDVIVIGSGPGGYVAAIRAAQLGMKTACVDKRPVPGGTCLNIGCIPSKALLQSSEHYEEAGHSLAVHGVKVGKVELDLKTMLARKDEVVNANTKGVEFLFRKNKVAFVKGAAKFTAKDTLAVSGEDGKVQELKASKGIIIATGSDSVNLPGITIDEKTIVSSTGALALESVPKHLVVVGGGYIGLEMGSVWRRLGAQVTVVEFLDRITPTMDLEVGKALQASLTKQGFAFKLGTKVTGAKKAKDGWTLSLEAAAGGKAEELPCDVVLVSVGRRPFTDNLGLDAVGVKLDNRGRITVDPHFATNVAGIYAIGDVIAGPMLAHKASEEGVVLVEALAGQKPHIDYDAIPAVIYTHPEVGSVGKTEEELKAAGVAYRVGKFPFTANARARANADTEGFVKIIADQKTDRVLGVHIIGADAGTMIAEAALAIEFGATAEDIARTVHAHPTLNEAVKEAALAVGPGAIHM